MPSQLIQLLRKAAWAPVTVVIVHQIVAGTAYRQRLDFLMHFSGGAAIAYFLFHALQIFENEIGRLTQPGKYLFAFALAVTIGVFWEFAELFSDVFLHTHIQKSIHETMSDLIADASGAFLALLLARIAEFVRRR